MRTLAFIVFAAVIAGCTCTPARTVVQTQTVEVPKYLRLQIPADLKPDEYAEPDPACWSEGAHVFCNGQLAQMRLDYRAALDSANAKLRAIFNMQAQKPKP